MTRGRLSPLGVAGRGASGLPPWPADLVRTLEEEFDLGAEAALLAWELCRCAPGLDPAEQRALMALVLTTLVNHRQGSTCLPVAGPGAERFDEIAARLGGAAAPAAARRLLADPRLEPILGRPGDYKPLIRDGARLYHQRMLHAEGRLAAALRARLDRPPLARPAAEVAAALGAVLADPPRAGGAAATLSPEQQYAVLCAVHAPLAVITGGPGTGKTSIVVSILRVLARLGVPIERIALAAPTGKAARRMEDSVRQSLESLAGDDPRDAALRAGARGRTLHRLLGYSPAADRFAHHEQNRLAEAVVIVDECSMIDLFLMDRLVRAVGDEAQLVLLGDAEQLPSVEAGAVFRDLIPAEAVAAWRPWRALVQDAGAARPLAAAAAPPPDPRARAAFRLSHSFRMDAGRPAGRRILEVARAINEGRAGDLASLVPRRAAPEALAGEGVELLPDEDGRLLEPFLAWWLDRHVCPDDARAARLGAAYARGPAGFGEGDLAALDELFRHAEAHRLLCLTRGGDLATGAAAVNARLHELWRARLRAGAGRAGPELAPGEPVMMLRNDYERGLFNGDQGLVLRVAEEGRPPQPMAIFRRGARDFAVFHLAALAGDLERCFAMTVHKAQGTELDHVGLVLPGRELALLTREILYTAVTRSRTSVVVVGPEALLARGVERRIVRFSGVGERLAGAG